MKDIKCNVNLVSNSKAHRTLQIGDYCSFFLVIIVLNTKCSFKQIEFYWIKANLKFMTDFENISQYIGKQQWNVKPLNGLEILKKTGKSIQKE